MLIRVTGKYVPGLWYVKVQNGHPAKSKLTEIAGCPVSAVDEFKEEYYIVVHEHYGMGTEHGGPYYIFSGTDESGLTALYELYQYDTLSLADFEI